MALRGAKELRARLNAIGSPRVSRDIAQQWATETVLLMRANVRRRTGATANTIRVQRVSNNAASVEAAGATKFLEGGTPPHPIEAKGEALKFTGRVGRTIFSKKVNHPRVRPYAYFRKSARAVQRAQKLAAKVTGAWDKAA